MKDSFNKKNKKLMQLIKLIKLYSERATKLTGVGDSLGPQRTTRAPKRYARTPAGNLKGVEGA